MKHVTALALLAPLLAACAPTYQQDAPRVTGHVVAASDYAPIRGARLYYETRPDQVVQTNLEGYFDFPAVNSWHSSTLWGPDRFNLSALIVEAPGYIATKRAIPVSVEGPYVVKIYMQSTPQ
jgi:hypothetical protein